MDVTTCSGPLLDSPKEFGSVIGLDTKRYRIHNLRHCPVLPSVVPSDTGTTKIVSAGILLHEAHLHCCSDDDGVYYHDHRHHERKYDHPHQRLRHDNALFDYR